MRAKPDATLEVTGFPTSDGIDSVLSDLAAEQLERLAVSVIREYRSKLQTAQDLFSEIERLEASGCDSDRLDTVMHDYRVAQLNLHGQHHLVSLVTARIGYIPAVDGYSWALN